MANGPIGYTCPDIDNCIELAEEAIKASKGLEDLLGRSGLLETLRTANETLRSWGSEQEDRADELEVTLGICEERLEAAEDMVKELQAQLESALLE